jgi:uncharacterized protein
MFQDTNMRKVGFLVGIAAIIALLAYTYFALVQAKYLHQGPTTITVSGEGEVFAEPDIAIFTFSVYAEGTDATTAQSKSAESINAIESYLESEGIEDRDRKTQNYNLSPKYEYPQRVDCPNFGYCPPGEAKIVGYEVSQTISVKVRNPGDIGALISGVGERGATNMSGPSFTIDDESALKAQAREMAIDDAKAKAEKLAADLDVRIVRMNGFWEDEGYMPYYGLGGAEMKAMDSAMPAVVPNMPMGENTVTSRVNISYEIR